MGHVQVTFAGARLGVLAAAVMLGCRAGPDGRDFAVADRDGDASITADEFARWGRDHALLAAFVPEGERTVGNNALARGLFQIWNVDGAGITETEWDEGVRVWFPDANMGTFANWDVDRNGVVEEKEMIAGFSHTDGLRSLDADDDGQIAPDELLTHFHGVFDADGDGKLTADEWSDGLSRWSWPI